MKTMEKTDHENVIKVYEMLHDDHYFYIAMECVEDGDLCQFLIDKICSNGRNTLLESEVKSIAHQLFSALDYLHK